MSQRQPWEVVRHRGRTSVQARWNRLRSKAFHILQCAIAAGVAWFVAKDVLGHPVPFFAPVTAVISLGTSYGQRFLRVAEVTLGVAIGVLVADLLVIVIGPGWWQLVVIVTLAMTVAVVLNGGALFLMQAAVQSIVIASLVPEPGEALLRWTDALVGGAVAIVAATVVPRAPLRRPWESAAAVVDKIAFLLRGAAVGLLEGDVESTAELLADARTTDQLIRELQDAAAEGLAVVAGSPFRQRHRSRIKSMADLVDPLDNALRNTRVLVRRVAVAAYRREPVPPEYADLCRDLAAAADHVAEELRSGLDGGRLPRHDGRPGEDARRRLLEIARATSEVDRSSELSAEVILAQLRSTVADLLRLTGLGALESTDAIPPLRPLS